MPIRYPQEAVLRDGRRLLVRPFAEPDVGALYEFFMRLPADVRRFAWDRIDSKALVESWGRELDYAALLEPAEANDQVTRRPPRRRSIASTL